MTGPKSPEYWRNLGYQKQGDDLCPACMAEVEVWLNKKQRPILLDRKTFESHFAGCPKAREYRMQQRIEAGVL